MSLTNQSFEQEKKKLEEDLGDLPTEYYDKYKQEDDKRKLGGIGAVMGTSMFAAGGNKLRKRHKRQKAVKDGYAEFKLRRVGAADNIAAMNKMPRVPKRPASFRPNAGRVGGAGRAWKNFKKGAGMVGAVAPFVSLPMLIARQNQMPVFNPEFGEQINGRYFDYKKAAGQWTWLLIAIDLILSFVPGLNIVSTILDMTDLAASAVESAVVDKNRTVTKYTDWVTMVEQLLVSIAYEDWKKQMSEGGNSQWTANREDIAKGFEGDLFKVGDDQLLPEEWVKDRKDGKISDALWKVLLKLARGDKAKKEIRELSDEEWEQLTTKYMIDTNTVSFVTDTHDQLLMKDIKNHIIWMNPAVAGQEIWTVDKTLEAYKKLSPEQRRDAFHADGKIFWNGANLNITGAQKYILFEMMMGNFDPLNNADKATKDFFKIEMGISPPAEGSTEMQVAASGEVTEEFYRQGFKAREEAIEPMWSKIESWMKRLGRTGKLKDINKLKEQGADPNIADPAGELQYIYDTRVNLFHPYVEQITNAKLNSDDPSRGGNDYTETWIKGFYDPATGTRYLFKDPVDAKHFWTDPTQYRGHFSDAVKDTLYIDDQGRGYTSMQDREEMKDKEAAYNEALDKLGDKRTREIELFKQNTASAPFVRQAGASTAGGAPFTGRYLQGGKASMAGGTAVQPSKK